MKLYTEVVMKLLIWIIIIVEKWLGVPQEHKQHGVIQDPKKP